MLLGVLLAAAAAGGLLAAAPRLLLRWYLREVRGMPVAAARGETIATYPLA